VAIICPATLTPAHICTLSSILPPHARPTPTPTRSGSTYVRTHITTRERATSSKEEGAAQGGRSGRIQRRAHRWLRRRCAHGAQRKRCALERCCCTCNAQHHLRSTRRHGEAGRDVEACVTDSRMLPKCTHTANEPEVMRETSRANADFKHVPLSQHNILTSAFIPCIIALCRIP